MARGYAYIASGMSMDGFLQFSGVKMERGYVYEEYQKLVARKKN